MIDLIEVSKNLIKYPSITPDNVGTIDYLANLLDYLGFKCQKLILEDSIYQAPVHNLYAKLGNQGKNFCFAGHSDVVPTGDLKEWLVDPFGGIVIKDKLYGRGAVDMKCAIACFIAAIANVMKQHKKFTNSISMLISGDEEGHANNGTPKILNILKEQGEKIDFCLVGEPSSSKFLGESVKIGRRGSLNADLTIYGKQGHVAYPENSYNPIKDLIKVFKVLIEQPLDNGNECFQPSNLEFTSIDINNTTCNIIPNKINAKFNIRFNNNYTGNTLTKLIKKRLNTIKIKYNLTTNVTGEAFINYNQHFCNSIATAIKSIVNINPKFNTTGGTSDARFLQKICPTLEFGLIENTAHQINEHVLINDLYSLTKIYQKIITDYC